MVQVNSRESGKRRIQQHRSFVTSKKIVLAKKASRRKEVKKERRAHRGGMVQVRPLDPTVHHSSNTERTTPAERSVHKVPLDNTLMVTADDFLLLAPAVELELGTELDDVAKTNVA